MAAPKQIESAIVGPVEKPGGRRKCANGQHKIGNSTYAAKHAAGRLIGAGNRLGANSPADDEARHGVCVSTVQSEALQKATPKGAFQI